MGNGLDELVEKVRGKTVVIYGESWSGKTTLAYALAKKLGKTLYLDADKNYQFKHNDNVDVVQINSFADATEAIKNAEGYDAVVIDSMSGLVADVIGMIGAGNPRAVLISTQSQENLVKAAKKKFNTVIIVAHVGADLRTGGERIRVNQSILRFADALIRVMALKDRRIVKVMTRKPIDEPQFEVYA